MTPDLGGTVLVPQDLSSQSFNAAWRAALVARDLDAPLQLLHVHAGGDAPEAGEELLRLAAEIRGRVEIDVEVQLACGDALAETVRASRDAALVVIGSRRGNPLRELVLGTQAERLIRLCRVPVLVVKRPANGGYRRVLVPVQLGPEAGAVIAAATRLSRNPRLEVLHALDTREEIAMRACDVPESVVRQQRQRAALRARRALEDLIAQAGAAAREARPEVGFGDAARVVLAREQALRADLLVIGKRTRGLLADFFLGSVTQRVLAAAGADVLVLPRPRDDARGAQQPRAAMAASASRSGVTPMPGASPKDAAPSRSFAKGPISSVRSGFGLASISRMPSPPAAAST